MMFHAIARPAKRYVYVMMLSQNESPASTMNGSSVTSRPPAYSSAMRRHGRMPAAGRSGGSSAARASASRSSGMALMASALLPEADFLGADLTEQSRGPHDEDGEKD